MNYRECERQITICCNKMVTLFSENIDYNLNIPHCDKNKNKTF